MVNDATGCKGSGRMRVLWDVKYLFPLLLFIGFLPQAMAQISAPPLPADTTDRVRVDYADVLEYRQEDGRTVQKLIGKVELRQDSIFMYCDSATIVNNNQVIAQGNVIIQQGDSLSIFSDSLRYDGEVRKAQLFSEVVLVNDRQKLFTERLDYDLNTRVARYVTGATLTNDTTQLTSKRGTFYTAQRQIYFADSVLVVNKDFTFRSDTLAYNTERKVAEFLAPTLITLGESRIYCEDGYYDVGRQLAVFEQNAQFKKRAQTASADVIRYDGAAEVVTLVGEARFNEADRAATADTIRYLETSGDILLAGRATYRDATRNITSDRIEYNENDARYATRGRSFVSDPPQLIEADRIDYADEGGIAFGDVIWRDTSAGLTVVCERAVYDERTDYLKASGGTADRTLLITAIDGDSLWLTADTLVAQVDTLSADSSRLLNAYFDVRLYKSDLQVRCDSMRYSDADSLFRFYQDPVVWSDTSQFTADTISIQLADDAVDRIFLRRNAFILNSPDQQFFNQIKGKNITADFALGELYRMHVNGNAQTVYYAQDDAGAYITAQKAECSRLRIDFGDNSIDALRFYRQPKGSLLPMRGTDHAALRLEGFDWRWRERPTGPADLYPAAPPLGQLR